MMIYKLALMAYDGSTERWSIHAIGTGQVEYWSLACQYPLPLKAENGP